MTILFQMVYAAELPLEERVLRVNVGDRYGSDPASVLQALSVHLVTKEELTIHDVAGEEWSFISESVAFVAVRETPK